MEAAARLAEASPGSILRPAAWLQVNLDDQASEERGVGWWQALKEQGGEGMVVKPLDFIARYRKRLVQPAIKCRGREYLRIIYGAEYTLPDQVCGQSCWVPV
jgi:protein phosphatase